jgi:hypothetical protein
MSIQAKNRSTVLFGSALIIVGALLLLHKIAVVSFSWWLILWGGLAVASLLVIVQRIRMRQEGAFWWVLLFAVSGYKFLDVGGWIDVPGWYGFPLFMFALAVAFGVMFAVRPRDWHLLVPAFACAGIGAVVLMAEAGTMDTADARMLIRTYWPYALILFGAALLANSRKR